MDGWMKVTLKKSFVVLQNLFFNEKNYKFDYCVAEFSKKNLSYIYTSDTAQADKKNKNQKQF